jgi:hypothetical protein
MGMNVTERGRCVATFRYVAVRLMETAAAWTPTTPEMEVKVLLGRHIWDFAQQADALGKRTFELRLPLQHSLRPADDYLALLDELRAREATAERLSALYDVVLIGLARRYEAYLAETDRLLDEPTVRILERILGDYRRQAEEAAAVRAELGLGRADSGAWSAREQALSLVAAGR